MALNTLKCNHLTPLPFKGLRPRSGDERRTCICHEAVRCWLN